MRTPFNLELDTRTLSPEMRRLFFYHDAQRAILTMPPADVADVLADSLIRDRMQVPAMHELTDYEQMTYDFYAKGVQPAATDLVNALMFATPYEQVRQEITAFLDLTNAIDQFIQEEAA